MEASKHLTSILDTNCGFHFQIMEASKHLTIILDINCGFHLQIMEANKHLTCILGTSCGSTHNEQTSILCHDSITFEILTSGIFQFFSWSIFQADSLLSHKNVEQYCLLS